MSIAGHQKDNYLVDVTKNIIKGFIVFGGLSAVFGAFIITVLFFLNGPMGSETNEQLKWCEGHHPTLNFSDCSLQAGW